MRERAVQRVVEHQSEYASQGIAIALVAVKIGCTAETLRDWVRQHEHNTGQRESTTTAEVRRIVGWRVSSSMSTDFVLDALELALYVCMPG